MTEAPAKPEAAWAHALGLSPAEYKVRQQRQRSAPTRSRPRVQRATASAPPAVTTPVVEAAKPRFPITAMFGLGFAVVIDYFVSVSLGPTTALGAITVAGAILLVLIRLATSPLRQRKATGYEPFLPKHRAPTALWLFLGWTIFTMAVNHDVNTQAVQNVSAYALFVLGVAVTAALSSSGTAATYQRRLGAIGVGASVFYLLLVLAFGPGNSVVYTERGFGTMSIVFLAAVVPLPRTTQSRLLRWAPYIIFVALAFSLSRTAGAAGIIVLIGRVVRGRKLGRALRAATILAVLLFGAVWLVNHNATLHNRFYGGDQQTIAGFRVNAEGRRVLWTAVDEQIRTDPIFGHGPGAAANHVQTVVRRGITQPHNDYLRLLDDFGWVGVALWAAGLASLALQTWRKGRRAPDPASAAPHYAALLGLVAISFDMITDNVIIYPFVMLPLAVLVGASLSQPIPGQLGRNARTPGPRGAAINRVQLDHRLPPVGARQGGRR